MQLLVKQSQRQRQVLFSNFWPEVVLHLPKVDLTWRNSLALLGS